METQPPIYPRRSPAQIRSDLWHERVHFPVLPFLRSTRVIVRYTLLCIPMHRVSVLFQKACSSCVFSVLSLCGSCLSPTQNFTRSSVGLGLLPKLGEYFGSPPSHLRRRLHSSSDLFTSSPVTRH